MPAPKPKIRKVCPVCLSEFFVSPSGDFRVCCSVKCKADYKRGDWQARFWDKVDRRAPDECWNWLGQFRPGGYGKFQVRIDGRRQHWIAHRLAYELTRGPIPEGMIVCHAPVICHNRACCNPAHLRLGTTKENADDRLLDGTNDHPERRIPDDVIQKIRFLRSSGWPITRIAKEMDLGTSTVWREAGDILISAPRKPKVKVTPELERRMFELIDQGMPIVKIASELNIHESVIFKRKRSR